MISAEGVPHCSPIKVFFSCYCQNFWQLRVFKITFLFLDFSRCLPSKFNEAHEWKFSRGFHSHRLYQISVVGSSSLLCPSNLLHVHTVGKHCYYSGLSNRFPTPKSYVFLPHKPLFFWTSVSPAQLYPKSCSTWGGGANKNITYTGCMTQAYVFHWLGCTECVLLGTMALHHYVAVCKPLTYSVIMNHKLCWQLSSTAWLIGLANSLLQSTLIVQLPLCGNQELDHFFCELPSLIKMACVDTTVSKLTVMATFLIMGPLSMILVSYCYIAQAVFQIPSADGRLTAFNTCSSHLLVVSLFYGSGIYIYIQPSGDSPQDVIKVLMLFYCIITPMANPFIYTLRNNDVKGALRRLLKRAILSKRMWENDALFWMGKPNNNLKYILL